MKKVLLLAAVLMLNGCGAQLARTTNTRGAQDNSDSQGGTFKHYDLASFKILDGNRKETNMKKYMADNKLDVAIFQFAGVICISCQEESNYFQKELNSYAGGKVGHVIVYTDYIDEYTEEQYKYFMKTFAPNGLRAHDIEAKLWHQFSINPALPARPTVLAVNSAGFGLLINKEGADVSPIMAALKQLDSGDGGDDSNDGDDNNDGDGDDNNDGLPPFELSEAQNHEFKDVNGNTKMLKDIFTSEYLIIDVSQFFCTYCKQLADSHQNNSAFHELMSGKKCRFMIAMTANDKSSWSGRYPANSYIGKNTFYTSKQGTIGPAFGLNISGIPRVFMINRKGEVVGDKSGGMPSEVNSLCKE